MRWDSLSSGSSLGLYKHVTSLAIACCEIVQGRDVRSPRRKGALDLGKIFSSVRHLPTVRAQAPHIGACDVTRPAVSRLRSVVQTPAAGHRRREQACCFLLASLVCRSKRACAKDTSPKRLERARRSERAKPAFPEKPSLSQYYEATRCCRIAYESANHPRVPERRWA